MSWVTVTWSMAASACLTLALVHLGIWLQQRREAAHVLLSVMAAALAGVAGFELAMMRAATPEQFGAALRWLHVPGFVLAVSLVWFVRLYLGAGRVWLAWAICVDRAVLLIVNFVQTPNINYRQITSLRQVSWWGGEKVSVAVGQPNPWMLLGQLGAVLLVVYLADAAAAVWRRGDHRRALAVGGSMIIFVVVAAGHGTLVMWGVIESPLYTSLAYMGIIAAMSIELNADASWGRLLARQLKVSEAALRDSEQRVVQAARFAKVGLWEWDVVQDKFWATDTVSNLFGIAGLKRIDLHAFLQTLHPDDREAVNGAFARAVHGEGDYESEHRVLLPDGRTGWMAARGQVEYDGAGRAVRMHGVSLDITERKQVEERMRMVVEASPTAMIMASPQGMMTMVNARVEAVFGYRREELIGKPVEILVPEAVRARHPGYRQGYAADPKARAMGAGRDLFGRRKDGSWVPVEIGLDPIPTADGLFVLASILDITDRQKRELESQRQRDELAHLSRVAMLGELSGSLAHELNQPLTAILSNAQAAQQFLARDPVDLDEVRAILADIVEDDRRAGEVIRRLRLLLKKGVVQQAPVNMNEIVSEVLKLVKGDLASHGVTVRAELDPELPAVKGDRVQLQQVLLNLIMNGCDAMAHVRYGDRRLWLCTGPANGDNVRVVVADRGCGIPADRVDRVFEPFFSTKKQGMGLGLAVCRTIVDAHGGRLWAANNRDRGASFYMTIPVLAMGASK